MTQTQTPPHDSAEETTATKPKQRKLQISAVRTGDGDLCAVSVRDGSEIVASAYGTPLELDRLLRPLRAGLARYRGEMAEDWAEAIVDQWEEWRDDRRKRGE